MTPLPDNIGSMTRTKPLWPMLSTRFFFSRLLLLVLVSSLLVIFLGIFASKSLSTLNSGNEWVIHAQRVRFDLSQVLQLAVDMGGGVRRFEMTRDESAFQDAEAAGARLPAALAELHGALLVDPELRELEPRLLETFRLREQQVKETNAAARAGNFDAIHAMTERGDNIKLIDDCRDIVAQMQDAENELLQRHRETTAAARRTVSFAISATTALAVILLLVVAFVSMRHTARLHEVQNELSTTLSSIGDAVIATDAHGRIRFMNPIAEELTGWRTAEARDHGLEEVFRIVNERTRQTVESPVTRVLRERRIVGLANHTILLGRQGGERAIEDSGAPIQGADGQLIGVVLVFRDATLAREAQRALIESEAALREADRRKDVFIATLSHELRNPLAPIRNAARLLESADLTDEELQRSRLIISRQVRHMASLLDDLLDISRITRDVLTLKKEIVGLRGLFEAAVETARPAIEAKNHFLEVGWPPDSLRIDADPVRLTQVITNLLTNAAKYTDPEGQIFLGYRTKGKSVIIQVRDNGIGLAPEMLTKVFDMFSQVTPTTKQADGGLGIGLALVKGLVHLHGGRVEALSDGLESGSEFVLYFPDSLVEAAPAPIVSEPPLEPLPVALRILIADDNRDSAESLGMLLELSGHDVFIAHDGLEALAVAARERPDAALLDIGMPGLDGYEVAASVRREPWGARMTLIAITGWGQEDAKRMAQTAGFDHHLTKPMDSVLLESLLAQVKRT
jgi:PAS domain S-box-containing protein